LRGSLYRCRSREGHNDVCHEVTSKKDYDKGDETLTAVAERQCASARCEPDVTGGLHTPIVDRLAERPYRHKAVERLFVTT
jgi:hypothetical protein